MSKVNMIDGIELSLEKLTVNYNGFHALDSVDLDVKPGKRVGIIGNNGAGKSTLFNCISGLISRDDAIVNGSIMFNSENVTKTKAYKRSSKKLGRVFQHPSLCEELTILENILIGSSEKKSSGILSSVFYPTFFLKNEKNKAKKMMTDFELDQYEKSNIETLPYATRKIIELARALMGNPKLLLLDEPCASMTDSERENYKNLLTLYLQNVSCTLLVIEHDIDFLKSCCEDLLVLDQGKNIAYGNIDEVLANEEVMNTYYGASI